MLSGISINGLGWVIEDLKWGTGIRGRESGLGLYIWIGIGIDIVFGIGEP